MGVRCASKVRAWMNLTNRQRTGSIVEAAAPAADGVNEWVGGAAKGRALSGHCVVWLLVCNPELFSSFSPTRTHSELPLPPPPPPPPSPSPSFVLGLAIPNSAPSCRDLLCCPSPPTPSQHDQRGVYRREGRIGYGCLPVFCPFRLRPGSTLPLKSKCPELCLH